MTARITHKLNGYDVQYTDELLKAALEYGDDFEKIIDLCDGLLESGAYEDEALADIRAAKMWAEERRHDENYINQIWVYSREMLEFYENQDVTHVRYHITNHTCFLETHCNNFFVEARDEWLMMDTDERVDFFGTDRPNKKDFRGWVERQWNNWESDTTVYTRDGEKWGEY